jgi:hypothetical protein
MLAAMHASQSIEFINIKVSLMVLDIRLIMINRSTTSDEKQFTFDGGKYSLLLRKAVDQGPN